MSTTVDQETRDQIPASPAEGDSPEATRSSCPSCGAPAVEGQLMCLECGARLALDYQRPPSWRLPAAIAGIVVLLAGAAVALALAKVTDDAGNTAAAPTQPIPNAAPADTPATGSQPAPAASAATSPAPVAGGATGPVGATGPAGATGAAGGSATPAPTTGTASWPQGKSAYTVIVASLPSKSAAEAKLKEAEAAGVSGAGILRSDDFPTLRPGWWVVFDGQFDTLEQATSRAEQDRSKGSFADAYPRFVSQDENAKP